MLYHDLKEDNLNNISGLIQLLLKIVFPNQKNQNQSCNMASFAKLGVDNIVTDIVHVDTIDNTLQVFRKGGDCIGFLTKHHGHETGDSVHIIFFEVSI